MAGIIELFDENNMEIIGNNIGEECVYWEISTVEAGEGLVCGGFLSRLDFLVRISGKTFFQLEATLHSLSSYIPNYCIE